MSRIALFLSVLLVACMSTYASQYSVSSNLAPSDAFDCVHETVIELDFSVIDANRDAGFIKARTNEPIAMRLDGEPFHDEITVSVLAADSGAELSISTTEKKFAEAIIERCQ